MDIIALTITEPPGNSVPTATNNTVMTNEDTAYPFKAGDFNFSDTDTDGALASVTIVTIPTTGELTLDGTAVTAGSSVEEGKIGDLAFTPAADANGTGYASFTFTVSDGEDASTPANTMTIDVTAVNDAATGEPTISGTAQAGQTLTADTSGIMDADGVPGTLTYQWVRVNGTDEDITGANSNTYVLGAADADKKVKVKVSFTDVDGSAEELTSAAFPASGTVVGSAVTVTDAAGLLTTEAGGTDTFQVALATQPSAQVTVRLTSSDTGEGTVSPQALTFTDSDWSTAQAVTVTGVNDADADGDQGYSITFGVTSTDSHYNGLSVAAVTVTNTNDDMLLDADTMFAGDGTVNIAEKAAGFSITGDTGSEPGVTVTVKLGSGSLTATSDSAGAWSVAVPMAAAYLVEPNVALTVSAAKTGFMAPAEVVGTVIVDLTAPTVSYTAPASLQVGSAFTATATTSDSDIDSYAAAGLPAGLGINAGTGEISGTPTAATAAGTVTVTVIDGARNETEVTIDFPNVAKGDQTLSGFSYSLASVTFGDAAPTVTAPTGAITALSYSAMPPAVCTVDDNTGALTIAGAGACEITVTASGSGDYNEASDSTTVTVQPAGSLSLTMLAVAGDDVVNRVEHADGFFLVGTTGTVDAVSVTVKIGSNTLSALSANGGAWSVGVSPNAAYLVEPSVTLTVSAAKAGLTSPADLLRTLTVDLTAPTATYAAPASLKVGESITAITPTGASTDIGSYAATGLLAGLTIDMGTGEISGTPTAGGRGRDGDGDGDGHRGQRDRGVRGLPGGGQGGPDAHGLRLQREFGVGRRHGADGDGADRGHDGRDLFGVAHVGMHCRRQHGCVDARGGGRVHDHGNRYRQRQLQRGHRHLYGEHRCVGCSGADRGDGG